MWVCVGRLKGCEWFYGGWFLCVVFRVDWSFSKKMVPSGTVGVYEDCTDKFLLGDNVAAISINSNI